MSASAVDIIIPIHGAADDLARCLASVARHTDLRTHGLLLALDGAQDADLEVALAQHAPAAARVLRFPDRLGFTGNANRAMRESRRDVVLLNSDTQVAAGWLDGLLAAAASDRQIGTVTPLSNNAALCSVPTGFEDNLLPLGWDVDQMAALVARVAQRCHPALPTAVGFCMWIRRSLLTAIGMFDQAHFPRGYGEENDFCLRASAAGWRHVCADDVYVQHAGQRSFGSEKAALQQAGCRMLRRLHPDYEATVAAFMRADPLDPVRARIVAALRAAQGSLIGGGSTAVGSTPRKVVHLVHGWPPLAMGGTEHYAWWLAHLQRRHREVAVYARMDDRSRAQGTALEINDRGIRVRVLNNQCMQRNPFARNAIHSWTFDRDFRRFLEIEQPDLVHVHHLVGHALSLSGVLRQLGVPIVRQVQDWWGLCATANYTHASGARCSGPSLARCTQCVVLTRIRPMAASNRLLHLARRLAARRSLKHADAYVMGSDCIRRDYTQAGMFAPGVPVHVCEYGVERPATSPPRRAPALPLRFGFIGAASPHKGLQIARAAFAGIDPALAVLEVWGYAGRRFAEDEKDQVYAAMDVLLFPSVGLESFGLAAREAMVRGVPVLASHDGALKELPAARFFPNGDVAALRAEVLALAQDPTAVQRWAAGLPAVRDTAAHATEIEAIYTDVLSRYPRRAS